ncbi:MAG: aminodeoxychorismate synthase component I [Planctomycetes bacterium]|nr:aminodeoxychorismate synthase component I [Planctomycetota bacterium]
MMRLALESVPPCAEPHALLESLGRSERPFLLESTAPASGLARWSFLGHAAPPVLVARGRDCRILEPSGIWTRSDRDPFEAARELLGRTRLGREEAARAPFPFRGGLVGWFGYEANRLLERLPGRAVEDLGLPHICLATVRELVAIDHAEDRAWVACLAPDRGAAASRAHEIARKLPDVRPYRRSEVAPIDELATPAAWARWRSPFSEASYAAMVERAREMIRDGTVFEVCLTHRFERWCEEDGDCLYWALSHVNPAPFAAYLGFPEAQVISSSPERFLRVTDSGMVESCPIKGTRPRGCCEEEDRELQAELASSEKDRAENLMIVDLVRNDLGRVCRFGTVHVPRLLAVERHPTVFQLVSEVAGELREGVDAIDAVRAAFPPGSMTGAPKIEAMKVIDAFEPVARGVYSGAIGYLDAAGGCDLSVAIRTFVKVGRRLTFSVGGAVVADSDPVAEYQETLDKARALVAAAALCAG